MFGSKESKIEKMIAKNNAGGIIKMINGKDLALTKQAIAALGKIRNDDSYNELVALLRSSVAEIRAAASAALGEMGYPKARAHIVHVSETETDVAALDVMKKAISMLHSNE